MVRKPARVPDAEGVSLRRAGYRIYRRGNKLHISPTFMSIYRSLGSACTEIYAQSHQLLNGS